VTQPQDPQFDFSGVVVSGLGRHRDLIIPGRGVLAAAPPDWPEYFFPGSLNVKVKKLTFVFAGSPDRLSGNSANLKWLDGDTFPSCFTIPHDLIGHNTLKPKWFKPRRGSAKIWRAVLQANGQTCHCWVMRRIGSHMTDTLELVSNKEIRKELGLTAGQDWPARLSLYPGNFSDPTVRPDEA